MCLRRQQPDVSAHPQAGSAQALQPLSQPQDGPAAQPLSQPQAAAPQVASQHPLWQQPLLTPSIRSSKSKPKLWVDNPNVSTRVPRYKFHFIDRGLLGS
jgi:hypothetical protein